MNKIVLLFCFLLIGGATSSNTEYVYICTGSYSKCYHKTDKCEGLEYCSKDIKKININKAKELKRKPCTYCY